MFWGLSKLNLKADAFTHMYMSEIAGHVPGEDLVGSGEGSPHWLADRSSDGL